MSMPAEHLMTEIALDKLLERFAAAPALPIADITIDSRDVTPGAVFIACAGATHHGLQFLPQAIAAGASACIYDPSTAADIPDTAAIPLIPVANLPDRLGEIANRYFSAPSERLNVIGVTGTNGKTTVAWMLAQCLAMLDRKCGYAGTLGFGVSEIRGDTNLTTPDVIEMHRRLAGFCDDGASHAAIEVSSHALDQRRIDGVHFDAALFTNLSRDHLDYHGDMRAYGDAKARLFEEHRSRLRIINLDSDFGSELASRCGRDVIAASSRFDRPAGIQRHVFVRSETARDGGSDVCIDTAWGDAEFFLPLPGDYNVANALLVIAYLLANDTPLQEVCNAIGAISAPPGRMQRVVAAPGPATYIDYAHTPNALQVALHALRTHSKGKLWCVFGCGGDRDAGKRPQMGGIAERFADHVVVTNDNPRSEAPMVIIDAILGGMSDPQRATVIEDRAAAISWAIASASDDDSVLIAGKGHENYQLIGGQQLEFSDYGAALLNLDPAAPEVDR